MAAKAYICKTVEWRQGGEDDHEDLDACIAIEIVPISENICVICLTVKPGAVEFIELVENTPLRGDAVCSPNEEVTEMGLV
jgi:hypothetical protein